jgi:hypothetical protein
VLIVVLAVDRFRRVPSKISVPKTQTS